MASNDRILVSVSEMRAAIGRYEGARNTLQDAFKKLESAKDHLDNCYKGPAYVALSVKWLDIYANVKTAENAIQESVNGLNNTISQMSEAEGAIGSSASSLDTGSSAPTYL
ncbi:MAG: WXG100 family type VII secretion target [Clostridia bacterium]|nr:WXG100 family type VII secretion target [Clostridia bacterium]MBQ4159000.1 WXG100 family type VII secretion target [Clostridia bacterium]